MPLRLPRRLARLNRRVTNPIQGTYAWLLPPWAVVVHRGRRSGRIYRTPVMAYTRDGVLAAVVMYGEKSDWVQNVLAGGGFVVRGGRTYELLEPRLVDVQDAASSGVSIAARVIGRISGRLLVSRLGARFGGFGTGPG